MLFRTSHGRVLSIYNKRVTLVDWDRPIKIIQRNIFVDVDNTIVLHTDKIESVIPTDLNISKIELSYRDLVDPINSVVICPFDFVIIDVNSDVYVVSNDYVHKIEWLSNIKDIKAYFLPGWVSRLTITTNDDIVKSFKTRSVYKGKDMLLDGHNFKETLTCKPVCKPWLIRYNKSIKQDGTCGLRLENDEFIVLKDVLEFIDTIDNEYFFVMGDGTLCCYGVTIASMPFREIGYIADHDDITIKENIVTIAHGEKVISNKLSKPVKRAL